MYLIVFYVRVRVHHVLETKIGSNDVGVKQVVAMALQSEGLSPQQDHVLPCSSYQLNNAQHFYHFLQDQKTFLGSRVFCDMDLQMARPRSHFVC